MSTNWPNVECDGDPDGALDLPLLDLLDALVSNRGRVGAAEVLRVNYWTMMACYDSRNLSRRMQQALADFRDAGGFVGGTEVGGSSGDGGVARDEAEPLEQRLAALEEEDRRLRDLAEAQAG